MSTLNTPHLDRLWKRGTDLLGTRYAIMGGAMTWVSEPILVAATSNTGAFGVLASGNMPPEALAKDIRETRKRTNKPFGVNLITIAPNFEPNLDTAIKEGANYIIFAGAIPPQPAIARAKDAGAKVLCFTPTVALGKRLVRQGVDALILEGHEAGGHIGPVSTSVLAQEILPQIEEVPVFVAGGIATGEIVASYLSMGASGVQVGTRLVVATECQAHARFKEAFIRAKSRDAMPTPQLDPALKVIPVRALHNGATRAFTRLQLTLLMRIQAGEMVEQEAFEELEKFWVGTLRRAVVDGDVENGSVMAGQCVGLVEKIEPAQDIIDDLVRTAERRLAGKD